MLKKKVEEEEVEKVRKTHIFYLQSLLLLLVVCHSCFVVAVPSSLLHFPEVNSLPLLQGGEGDENQLRRTRKREGRGGVVERRDNKSFFFRSETAAR